jgi:hypothetical protein
MTTAQEEDIQPTDLIHWLYEDSLILEVCEGNYYGGGEEDLSIDCDLNRIVQEQVRSYQTTDILGRMIERELDNLTTVIRQKLPKGRIREASRQLQAPGSYDPLTIPHHPTTEMLLHRLLNQEGELKPGNGWMPESRARCVAPDIFKATREAALEFKLGEHLLDEIDRETAYLSGQALKMLEEAREPSRPDSRE